MSLFLGLVDDFWLVAGALVVGGHRFVVHHLHSLLRKRLLLRGFGTGNQDGACRGLLHGLVLSEFFNLFGRHLFFSLFVLLILGGLVLDNPHAAHLCSRRVTSLKLGGLIGHVGAPKDSFL